jgi:hypothetical protein
MCEKKKDFFFLEYAAISRPGPGGWFAKKLNGKKADPWIPCENHDIFQGLLFCNMEHVETPVAVTLLVVPCALHSSGRNSHTCGTTALGLVCGTTVLGLHAALDVCFTIYGARSDR